MFIYICWFCLDILDQSSFCFYHYEPLDSVLIMTSQSLLF